MSSSDNEGNDQIDFEKPSGSVRPGKRDHEEISSSLEQTEKKSKQVTEEEHEQEAEEEHQLEEARYGEAPVSSEPQPENVLQQQGSGKMYTKTMNVKDICSIITGCCSVPGVEAVLLTFSPLGLEFYTKPAKFSPVCISAFYNKSNFCVYNVPETIKHVILKSELDDLKKRIAKDVTFLEISEDTDGFIAGGRRTYKTGDGCDFKISLTSMLETTLSVTDMSELRWTLQVRTASQQFSDNVAFFDDQVKWIKLSIESKRLSFSGIRDAGTKSKEVNQTIASEFSGKYAALFNKKILKGITSARDINRSLCISVKMEDSDFPVHFMYEIGQDHPQSHFSVYIAPSNAADSE